MKNIMVTGNLGYIGLVLTDRLASKGYNVIGYDIGYYEGCEIERFVSRVSRQIRKDIREVDSADLKDVDAIVHLAALSNDPLGEFDPNLTDQINRDGTIRLAELAKARGVQRFIYSSSQSMYGIAKSDEELDEDRSEKNPITAYARTKWEAECGLKELGTNDFLTVCLRPSTVFGVSPRLRCDIVFNNLVACAYTKGRIEVKSDGTPWRPVVHIQDVCSAYIAGLEAPAAIVAGRSFNVGIKNGNYTVRELAEAAGQAVPGSSVVFTGEHGKDSRTYKVGFTRILTELRDYYKPEWDLRKGGRELVELFKRINFTEDMFQGRSCNRLLQLKHLIKEKYIDQSLKLVK